MCQSNRANTHVEQSILGPSGDACKSCGIKKLPGQRQMSGWSRRKTSATQNFTVTTIYPILEIWRRSKASSISPSPIASERDRASNLQVVPTHQAIEEFVDVRAEPPTAFFAGRTDERFVRGGLQSHFQPRGARRQRLRAQSARRTSEF